MTVFENISDDTKAKAFEFYWRGYQLGLGVEETTKLDRKTAYSNFEQYLERNYE